MNHAGHSRVAFCGSSTLIYLPDCLNSYRNTQYLLWTLSNFRCGEHLKTLITGGYTIWRERKSNSGWEDCHQQDVEALVVKQISQVPTAWRIDQALVSLASVITI